MTAPASEPATERWTYGGIRATGKDGKRRYAWLDLGREELQFSATPAGTG